MSKAPFRDLGLPFPLGLVVAMASACAATSMTAGCSATTNNTSTDGGPSSMPDGGSGPLSFTPSNVDLGGMDLSKVGDFIVDNDECSINTDNLLASCGDGGDQLAFKIATQSDGSKVAVYVAKSMTIKAGQNLTVVGSLPLVFIALDAITITGSLNANATSDVGIAGGSTQMTMRTKGTGAGGGGPGTASTAGGGGSYCGTGGIGGAESGTAAAPAPTYGTAEIAPLVAGSSGGAGDGTPGAGGGGIQLVAGASITIDAAGLIQVGAGGGGFGGISGQEANGGGSGGSILLEAPAVTVAGALAANGGGGGTGTASDVGAAPPLDPGGQNSTPNATPAAGGKKGVGPSSGGDGSAASTVNGAAGAFTAGNAGGGGGGGAGRIRINTRTAQATLGGVVSPALSTPCATQGTLRP